MTGTGPNPTLSRLIILVLSSATMSFRDRAPLLFILLVVATWGGRGYRGLDGVGLDGVGLDGVV